MSETRPQGRRDRDDYGRARNARPRDALGRPLAYGSENVERLPEGIERSSDETIDEAQRLLDAGLPFHTHEVFEDAWKFAAGGDRELWKGLAQLAVGLTHIARGNRPGAATLLARAISALEPFADDPPHELNVAGLISCATGMVIQLDQGVDVAQLDNQLPRLRR